LSAKIGSIEHTDFTRELVLPLKHGIVNALHVLGKTLGKINLKVDSLVGDVVHSVNLLKTQESIMSKFKSKISRYEEKLRKYQQVQFEYFSDAEKHQDLAQELRKIPVIERNGSQKKVYQSKMSKYLIYLRNTFKA